MDIDGEKWNFIKKDFFLPSLLISHNEKREL
jgi:hypothetical protein